LRKHAPALRPADGDWAPGNIQVAASSSDCRPLGWNE
jgi:hypothetical protein